MRVTRVSEDEAPALRQLLQWYSPGAESEFVDPDAPAECALHQRLERGHDGSIAGPVSGLATGHLDDLIEQLHGELERSGGDDEVLAARLGVPLAVPTGSSWHAWCRYLMTWLPAEAERPSLDRHQPYGASPPRASRFTDTKTADAAVADVLRACEAEFRSWAVDDDGPRRLHLYADLERDLGVVMPRAVSDGDPGAVSAEGTVPATACVVVVKRDQESGRPTVVATYPDLVLPGDARQRYPDLPLLLGAYFGQDYDGLDADRWNAERVFNLYTPAPVKQRIADQLHDLLAEDDAVLRVAVEALGSYVLPTQLRRWVAGLRRRMTTPDWTLPRRY